VRSHSLFLALCAAIGAGGACDGTVVDLGDPRPPPYRFDRPRLLAELDMAYGNENPTLTGDLLDLFFTSGRADTNGDVWTAHRAAPGDPFDPPARVDDVSSSSHEASPAISLDGLSIYFGSNRDTVEDNLDIWSAVRPDRAAPWSGFENLAALNSAVKDIPRPPGQHGLVMPMASERDLQGGGYLTYLSARANVDQPFGPPAVISGLTGTGATLADAFLSDDGLTLFYASSPNVGAAPDLFVAWRLTTADRFSLPTPLTDLNTADDERDPWLSPDGTTFFFSSDRAGSGLQIYEVAARRQTRW
jgi:hypothetical protein